WSKAVMRRCSTVAYMADLGRCLVLTYMPRIYDALAKEFMSGGANSRVRAFKSVGGQPIVIDSVKGSHVWDIDGNEYIDYVGSWGPAIIGHVNDEV
ncbi:glutamate-1-semialdehyde 2,1-aminomutase, chloroplastic-like protein, partial [Tanacetum coccineum]